MNNNLSVTKLSSFLLLLCLVYSSPAISLQQVTLQLKWKHQFQFAGYYAAVEKGFYAEEGLEVTIHELDATQNHIQVVINGDAEYGVSDSSIILHRLKGKPVVVLAPIFQHSPLVLMTKSSDDIIGPMGLKGKRVMWQKDKDDAAITALFYQLGIKLNDLSYVPHNYDDNALIKGDVDAMSAYSTDQPFVYKELGISTRIINPINYGIDFYGDMLFTSESEIKSNPEKTMRFLRASLKGWEYALQHKNETINWIINKYGSTKSIKQLKNEADATERIIQSNLVEIGHLSINRFHQIANIYRELEMVSKEADIDGIDSREYFYKKNNIYQWVWWILFFAIAAFITAIIFWGINHKLKALVDLRTQEIKAQSKHIEQIISATQVGTWKWNIITGKIILNERWAELIGYTLIELYPTNANTCMAFIHPDDLIIAEQRLKLHFEGKTDFYETDFRMKHKNGHWVWFNARGQVTQWNKNKKPLYMSGTDTDISERKEFEQKIAQLNQSLKIKVKEEVEKNKQQQLLLMQQSRLAQMGEMISMIAHQWRQPLNNLALLNQTIAFKYDRGKLNDSLMNDFNKNSNKQIQGMSKTINDFRNFFKPEKEKKEYCVNDVIIHTMEILNPAFIKNELNVTFPNDSQYYSSGFENELGQALINIINNAIDALVEYDIKDKNISINLAQKEDKVIINISDNAGGIPIEIIDKIFDPYFSTKEEKNGTGLGLYMTKLIIEEHMDGKIMVLNTNSGANFNICLDLSYTE